MTAHLAQDAHDTLIALEAQQAFRNQARARWAMAQAAALLAFDTLDVKPDDKTVYYFAGIDGARFKRPVEPGDQLVMDVTLERMKSGLFKFKGISRVGDEVACEAELMCTMRTIA